MIQISKIAFVLLCSLTSIGGCKKGAEKAKEAVSDTTEVIQKAAEKTAGKVVDVAVATKNAMVGDPTSSLRHLSDSTEIVISFTAASARNSSLWKELAPMLEKAGDGDLSKFKTKCGFDPIANFESILIGINSTEKKNSVIIIKGFDREELVKCFAIMAKEEKDKKTTLIDEGNFSTIIEDGEIQQILGWVDSKTFLISQDNTDKVFIQARIDGVEGLDTVAAFSTYMAKASKKEAFWFAGIFSAGSDAAKQMAAVGNTPEGVFGSLGIAEGLTFDGGMTFADEKAAAATLKIANTQIEGVKGMPGVGGLVKNLKMSIKDSDLLFNLILSKAELEQLIGMAKMMGLGR